MKLSLISIALASSILVSSIAQAEPAVWNAVNVMPFDVAGVKLGMSYDQAVEALAKKFQIQPKELSVLKKGTLTTYSRITKSVQPTSVRYTSGQTSVEVTFSVRIPVSSSNTVAVSRIAYGVPNTKENNNMVKEMALSKYGPSSDSRDINMLKWCEHFNLSKQCDTNEPSLEMFIGSVVLVDPTIDAAGRAYENSLLATKPNF